MAAAYEVGQLVRGTVTQLANFGAFARIEDGIEGLIHVSELVDDRVTHPKQVVTEGDDLLLRIIRIDPLGTFESILMLTSGGPGVATLTLGFYSYRRAFSAYDWVGAATSGWFIVAAVALAGACHTMLSYRWRDK